MTPRELEASRRWSVVEQGADEVQVVLHQVSLRAALAEILRLHAPPSPITRLERLEDLQILGVLRFDAWRLGTYRKPRDAEGLRSTRLRKQIVLTWGARPPLHETVLGITWDHEPPDAGGADEDPGSTLVLGDELVAAVHALLPGVTGAAPGAPSIPPPRPGPTFDELLRLRALTGWKIARNLELPLGDTMAGGEARRGATFVLDGRHDVDACMKILDELTPPASCRRSVRQGAALALHYQGVLDERPYELVLLDDPTLERIAVRIVASAREQDVVDAMGAALGGSKERGWAEGRRWSDEPGGGLCAALSWPPTGALEERLRADLAADDLATRRSAYEVAVLRGTPRCQEILEERRQLEPDPQLRADLELVLALLGGSGSPPAPGALASTERALGSLQERRLHDGLQAAASLRAARLRPRLLELSGLSTVSKDVRFVARALLVFGPTVEPAERLARRR